MNSTCRAATISAISRYHTLPGYVLGCVRAPGLPRRGAVVLQETTVEVLAGFSPHDRVVDPGRAVHQVQWGMETLVGEPDLGVVRSFIGDPAGVHRGHQDAVGFQH